MPSQNFLRLYNYMAIAIGSTSFSYSIKTGEYTQRLWSQVVAIVANMCTILSLPWIFWNGIERISRIQWNPMMNYSMYVSYSIRTLVIVYTILKRNKIDLINCKVLLKYQSLSKAYLDHLPRVVAIERQMNRFFYVKYLLMLLLLCQIALNFFISEISVWNLKKIYIFLMVLHSVAYLQWTLFNYFWLLWLICYSLKYVKFHFKHLLLEIDEALRQGKHWRLRLLTVHVQRILEVHWQLADLARIVNRNYHFLVLAVLMDRTMSLVLQIYYGAIFTFDRKADTYVLLIGSAYFYVMAFDMYLIFLICDLTVYTYHSCVYKLRRSAELDSENKALKQVIEKFFLRIHNNSFSLDLCGVMLINKETWLRVMQNVAYESLTLVQFHMILNTNKNFN